MAGAILLSLLGFVLWLLVDLPPLARSFSRRIAASLLGSALLAVAYFRAESLGTHLNLPRGVQLIGWMVSILGTGLLLFSVFVEIPLRLRSRARLQPSSGVRGSVHVTQHGTRPGSLLTAGPAPAAPIEPVLVTSGTYALSRHPGVLWLVLFLAGSVLRSNHTGIIWLGLFWLAVDLLHVAIQDRLIFPSQFSDYRAYQRTTPFLIPTSNSVRRFFEGREGT